MKRICFVFFFMPLLLHAQKIRLNEMDKFIRQKRIETFPLTLLSASKNKMAVSLSAVGSALYLQLSGAGIGANRIEENDRVIFLLENDSTVTVYSKGYQNFDIGISVNSYVHNYKLSIPDLQLLSRHPLQALRKYHSDQYDDIYISKEASEKFRALTLLFLNELAKENLIPKARSIALRDINKHVGDSVTFVARIAGGRYLFDSKEATVLLDVGAASPNEQATVVIQSQNRKNFNDQPHTYYQGKMARISGKVVLMNGKPHIGVERKEQLVLVRDSVATAANAPVTAPPATQTANTATSTKPVSSAPGFPGGYEVWMNFLNNNLKPPADLKAGEQKTVVVQFQVAADGTVGGVQIVQSAGVAYDKEVLRVLARMPKWKAAIENGVPVKAVVTQPVTFYGVQAQKQKAF